MLGKWFNLIVIWVSPFLVFINFLTGSPGWAITWVVLGLVHWWIYWQKVSLEKEGKNKKGK